MPIKSDFQTLMRGEASFESAVVAPELATDQPLDTSVIMEIREDRQEVDQELEALIVAEPENVKPIVQSVGAVEAIATGATSVDAVTADAYVPVSNASMEQFARILEVEIPKLEQQLNGQISLESLDSVRGWVTQAAQSFRSSVKNFFARIAAAGRLASLDAVQTLAQTFAGNEQTTPPQGNASEEVLHRAADPVVKT